MFKRGINIKSSLDLGIWAEIDRLIVDVFLKDEKGEDHSFSYPTIYLNHLNLGPLKKIGANIDEEIKLFLNSKLLEFSSKKNVFAVIIEIDFCENNGRMVSKEKYQKLINYLDNKIGKFILIKGSREEESMNSSLWKYYYLPPGGAGPR